jgi:ferredoxin-type protein NapF
MTTDLSRRSFLRGRLKPQENTPLRPPWALDEERFSEVCTRCMDCAPACPEKIVVTGDGGYPTLDFSRGECTFCGDCLRACKPRALQRDSEDAEPWSYRASIGSECLAYRAVVCRTCGEWCEWRAIRFELKAGGVAHPHLDTGLCNGCGACVKPCPVRAIRIA